MKVIFLERSQFDEFYNLRNFNPPPEGGKTFDDEFWDTLGGIRKVMELFCRKSGFSIHPGHNNSRFIDIYCEGIRYIRKDLVIALQQYLASLPEEWMICLWFTVHLFVTKSKVYAHSTTGNYDKFATLLR